MKLALLTIGMASTVLVGVARAEPDEMLPVQGDIEVQLSSGSQLWTSSVYLDLSVVRPLVNLDSGWRLFGGVGFADDVVTYWQRDGYRAPDALSPYNQPGIEGRLGLVHGTQLGAPRIVVKATPLWARGATSMALPGDRGPGLRASVGVAWPAWLLGRIDPEGHGHKSDATYAFIFAAFVPSEIEYVYTHVPGDDHHGVAFGWSL